MNAALRGADGADSMANRAAALPTPAPLARADSPESVGLSSVALARMREHWQREVDGQRIPGAVVLVARHGRLACFDAIGWQDVAAKVPMATDSIFRIFSMTKPIVSVAIMMLVERGRLRLIDSVARWLPEFSDLQVGVPLPDGRLGKVTAQRAITIQDLLRHTSGLTYDFTGTTPVHRLYASERLGDRKLDNAEGTARLAKLPLLCEPGTRWEYSRSTDVLGRVIEVVSGQSLGQFLQAELFEPLGMRDTGFWVDPARAHRIAEPLPGSEQTPEAVRLFDPRKQVACESGGGGLMSTADDYARFLQMLLDGGVANGQRLMSRKTIELMTADHLGNIPVGLELLPPGQGFGLGFAVRKQTGVSPFPGSPGTFYWSGIAGTAFFVDPVERLFAILLTQAPGPRIENGASFRQLVYASFDD